MNLDIRSATSQDEEDIWEIMQVVISTGDTYVFHPDSSKERMMTYWFGADKHTYVASLDDQIVGTFIIKANQPDLGSHVANASYMTHPNHLRKGIGYQMGEASLEIARNLGFEAMQFNIVVESNAGAIRLWKKLGFKIVGGVPEAFKHRKDGNTDILIMWRKL
jgi:L-amino acid N-acyltransferase YncA